jgi:DNA-binding CsgD family transcriptional regulator
MALRRLWDWIKGAGGQPEEAQIDVQQAWHSLTRRERQVVEMAQRGFSTAGIAYQLGMGEETVRTHLRNIYRKFGVHSRLELFEKMEELEDFRF